MSKEEKLKAMVENVLENVKRAAAEGDLTQEEISGVFHEISVKYPQVSYAANETAATAIGLEIEQMNLNGTIGKQPEKYKALSDKLIELTSHLEK